MALTRHTTGHSAPRQAYAPATSTTTKRTTTTKKPKPKTNALKPGAKTTTTTTGGRVAKPRGRPRKTGLKDKVEGLVYKVIGTVERKPGKKVRDLTYSLRFI